jgi:IS30 family transposase
MGADIPFSKRSFYRHVHKGYYGLNAFNLPRKVRYKQRSTKIETAYNPNLEGRTYDDWLELSEEERLHTVQIDCIKGKKGEKEAILSVFFPLWRFQMFLKLEVEDASHVSAAFDALEYYCGKDDFAKLFKTVLADRGSGFPAYKEHEKSIFGKRRMKMYFCDTRRPEQKGACEKNHVEFRRIVPKGSPLGSLTACDLALITSHVNSYTRAILGGKTPYCLASRHLPLSLLEALGIERIAPSEVVLKPYLLKVKQVGKPCKEEGEK